MPYLPVDPQDGVFKNSTRYQAEGRWYDCNWMRWTDGSPRPIGGWVRVGSPLTGKSRKILAWKSNANAQYTAIGTSSKLYVSNDMVTFNDITPVGFSAGYDDASGVIPATTWTMDNWGENLIGCARGDGKIYQWAPPTVSTLATVASSAAPTNNRAVLVTEQRHLMALGANGDPRSIKWSDKEDLTNWTASDTNEAGGFPLVTNGEIMCGVKTRGQILVLTTSDAHVINYIGQPYIFNRDKVGIDCAPCGPGAVQATVGFAVWMGPKRFYIYEGSTVEPLPCDVADYVFNNINNAQMSKVVAGHYGEFGEVWWFYPSASSTENDTYVVWNYREKIWYSGQLPRTCWADEGTWPDPYAVGADNYVYKHETGWLDNGNTRVGNVWAESGVIQLGNGDNVMNVVGLIQDEDTIGSISLSFKSRMTPGGAETSYGPFYVKPTGYTDARFSGRQVTMRVGIATDAELRFGKIRLDVRQGSKR